MSNDNAEVLSESEIRGKVIVRTSIIGIITNVVLAVFKAILGILVNSIALTLDAFQSTLMLISPVVKDSICLIFGPSIYSTTRPPLSSISIAFAEIGAAPW